MRVWDISPSRLCRNHLLAEHREIHAIWSILVLKKKGFSTHPETLRWKGKLRALYLRHESVVEEFEKRGYRHNSPLDRSLARGTSVQDVYLVPPKFQLRILKLKKCDCKV
ncbi:MAG: pyrimidine dimer DNA glycosylase [Nitrososphaerota archaeon]|nr:pyrimidine dimer DNA glycosylase [Nitrososphaerota archaeon]